MGKGVPVSFNKIRTCQALHKRFRRFRDPRMWTMVPKLEVPRTQEGSVVMGQGQACGQKVGPVLPTHPACHRGTYRARPGSFHLALIPCKPQISITCLMFLFGCLFLPNIEWDTLNKVFQFIDIPKWKLTISLRWPSTQISQRNS